MSVFSTTSVIIPMKNPTESKQRLSSALNAQQRSGLAVQLFKNTLAFFRREFPDLCVLVVTPSAWVAALAREYGHQVLLESSTRGLNKALDRATEWSLQHKFQQQLIIPADIAELRREEIIQVLGSLSADSGVLVARSKDGGTNALLCSPANAIPFSFGLNSARHHAQLAQLSGLSCSVVDLPKLSKDVDVPDDIPLFMKFEKPLSLAVNYV